MQVVAQTTMLSPSQFLTVGDAQLVHAERDPRMSTRVNLYFLTSENALTDGVAGAPREFRYVVGQTLFPDTFDHVFTFVIEGFAYHILRAKEDLS